jgi:hypothetical protein
MSEYAGARTLRTFDHLGETFTVVRWRDHRGKHWRGYTALLHDGVCVSDDIARNSVDPWETQFARVFRDRAEMLENIAIVKLRRNDA